MLSSDELRSFREKLLSYRASKRLPFEADLDALVESALDALEKEDSSYRPYAKDSKPGGLLDFKDSDVPVVLVPDLHSRPDFLPRLLDSPSPVEGRTVLEALNEESLIVLCVGDGVHTETPGMAKKRWLLAYERWLEGDVTSTPMALEIFDTWATMAVVFELKKTFPRNFHFLKGNHENVYNAEGGGDHSFRKYVQEGSMVRDFISEAYSDMSLHLISCFEKALPIVAAFRTFCVSHAEPLSFCRRKDIVEYRKNPLITLAFTWTANGDAKEGDVAKLYHVLLGRAGGAKPLWFGGHRPVEAKYLLRQGGTFVQFHNPLEENVIMIPSDAGRTGFDPESHIVSLV